MKTAAGCPGRDNAMCCEDGFRITGEGGQQGLGAVTQLQQKVTVLGKEIVEAQRCPILRCDERCIRRPLTCGGADHSSGVFLDDRAVPVLHREPRECLAELFRHRRDLREQGHHDGRGQSG